MKRMIAVVGALLVSVGCEAPNPDFCDPAHFDDCARAFFASRGWERAPDLAGFQVVPLAAAVDAGADLSPVVDLAGDLATFPDLQPAPVPGIGAPCDGGAPAPFECSPKGKVCSPLRGACVGRGDCCDPNVAGCGLSAGNAWRCCTEVPGGPCADDSDCCYSRGGGRRPSCAAGVCS